MQRGKKMTKRILINFGLKYRKKEMNLELGRRRRRKQQQKQQI